MKKKKAKKKTDFELIPLPSNLQRYTKKELIREVEQRIDISNRIIEGHYRNRLLGLEKDIIIKTQESHIAHMKCRQQELERQILTQKEQLSDFKTELSKSENSFSLNALPI